MDDLAQAPRLARETFRALFGPHQSPLPLVGQARMRFASTAYRTIGNRWRQLAPAANLPASTGNSKGEWYAFRRCDVLCRLFDVGAGACPRARGARFRVDLGAGALAYPAGAEDAISGRRGAAQSLLRRDGPVRGTGRGQ